MKLLEVEDREIAFDDFLWKFISHSTVEENFSCAIDFFWAFSLVLNFKGNFFHLKCFCANFQFKE